MKALLLSFALASAALAQHDASHHTEGTVESRGNQVMGFDQQKATHNFLIQKNGGVIRVTAKENDEATVAQIREHLGKIATEFKAGNFVAPELIHDKVPPGSKTLKRLKDEIAYSFVHVPGGAELRLTTENGEARQAIREFFKMQIEEHKTGDPVR